ncbi:hypothetical protein [Paludisphaera mucosa]|uniref:Glycoside hydrolase family 42 N-terminal domain-containing protein n=1 Tax=Paludisphaera mucosa TaxID=3030827 RepID=A0ABT6FG73_9BACT|nr:hypothetical protein [Paludisphaera mucosa]MDG3006524.1 hypothetical protein [Paludisphaera mucosa]
MRAARYATFILIATAGVLGVAGREACGQTASPWGVSSSASGYGDHAEWLPKAAAAGVRTVRLFPEWGALEPKKGEFQWQSADTLVGAASANRIELEAVLMGGARWAGGKPHAFPMANLADWSDFVAAAAGRYRGKVRR